jgi:beta-N-acetylhexosaminidase
VARARAALDAGCDFILVCNDPEAVDPLLAELRWERDATFEQRLAQIAPRDAPTSPGAWRNRAAYRAALQDLDQFNRT